MRPVVRSLLVAALVAACGGPPPPQPEVVPAAPSIAPSVPVPPTAAPKASALGDKPNLEAPTPFSPPVARVLSIPDAPVVWLIERHSLPLVAVEVVVPSGSAADPEGRGGLAALTAEMMEQGAGTRGALEITRAAELLGAQIQVGAGTDAWQASLAVLKPHLEPALELLSDVVARPRFEAAEWGRIKPLAVAALRARAFEPGDVAEVASRAVLYGPKHPYGHPVAGTLASIEKIGLDDVKRFHHEAWRPDRATLVIVGDVTEAELRTLLPKAFRQWAGAGKRPAEPKEPAAPKGPFPRVVLVDRPGSPQTMLALVAPGPAAADPIQAALGMVNLPLGGSFTSRLNQNLREDNGYTYGAHSSVPFSRWPAAYGAGASVESKVTGPALTEMLKEIEKMAAEGPTAEELVKARASTRNQWVEIYEGVETTAGRLGRLAGLGLPADFDAKEAQAQDRVDPAAALAAAKAMTLSKATIVAVGDRKTVLDALKALGLPAPQVRDPEGAVGK